jgi:hydroxymethylglutaryl-CoA reductase
MSLHARSVSLAVGAREDEVNALAEALISRGQVKLDLAQELLTQLRRGDSLG